MTTTTSWLPLTEYSMKHQVSISTLRRRIKAEDIKFRFDDGKYFILDEDAKKSATPAPHRPSLSSDAKKSAIVEASARPASSTEKPTATAAVSTTVVTEAGESVITAANKLLSDLKKAYTQVLQDKEEQILQLREEIVDLRTLIKVLESENSRLRDRQ